MMFYLCLCLTFLQQSQPEPDMDSPKFFRLQFPITFKKWNWDWTNKIWKTLTQLISYCLCTAGRLWHLNRTPNTLRYCMHRLITFAGDIQWGPGLTNNQLLCLQFKVLGVSKCLQPTINFCCRKTSKNTKTIFHSWLNNGYSMESGDQLSRNSELESQQTLTWLIIQL